MHGAHFHLPRPSRLDPQGLVLLVRGSGLTSSYDRTGRIWPVERDAILALAEHLTLRELSEAELRRYATLLDLTRH